MKTINTLFAFALAFVVVLTSSCFDSGNNGDTYDGAEYVRVDGSYPYYDVVGDSGTKYAIANPEKMRITTSEGDYEYERAQLWFKYEEAKAPKSNSGLPVIRQVKVISVNPLPVQNFNYRPDTLKVEEIDYVPFIQVAQPWGDQYFINTSFITPYSDKLTTKYFTLFVEDSSENTLNLRLLDTRKDKDLQMGQPTSGFISFKLDKSFLRATYNLNLSDSITVNISAEERGNGVKKFAPFKIKFDN